VYIAINTANVETICFTALNANDILLT